MKLSEAILLGDSLRTRNPREWLTMDGACGCALGGAVLAVGGNSFAWASTCMGAHENVLYYPKTFWPWLTDADLQWISLMFGGVCEGCRSFESLVDCVREREPACGECCRFECKCESAKTAELAELAELARQQVECLC